MKKQFATYYPLKKDDYKNLWGSCLFVPDANVLLDLYRYSNATRKGLLSILMKIADRLWLPHQVGIEYFENRPAVIYSQIKILGRAQSVVKNISKHARAEINKNLNFRAHPIIDKEEFQNSITNALEKITKRLESKKNSYPNLMQNDNILEEITRIFEGRVGEAFSKQKLKEIYEKGKFRYHERIPPGYTDAEGKNKKEGMKIYGDLIIWLQMINKAKETNKPIIFISNDEKEDWWWQIEEKTIGCRPELMEEMREEAGVLFYMYNSEQFMKYAKTYLKIPIQQKSIDEVKELRVVDDLVNKLKLHSFTEADLDYMTEIAKKVREIDQMKGGLAFKFFNSALSSEENLSSIATLSRAPVFLNDFLSNYEPPISNWAITEERKDEKDDISTDKTNGEKNDKTGSKDE